MRSAKLPLLKLLSLAAVLVGAAFAAACGGGGAAAGASLVLDAGVALPPAAPPAAPPGTGAPPPAGGEQPPAEEPPAEEPPAEEPPATPPEGTPAEPPAPIAPDLAQVSAAALVGDVLYAADAAGRLWKADAEALQWAEVVALGHDQIEALAHVHVEPADPAEAAREFLYFVSRGRRLARLDLDTLAVEALPTSDPLDQDQIQEFASVTGLAFDRDAGVLYGLDHDRQALFHFATLDRADTVLDMDALGFVDGDETLGQADVAGWTDLQDLTYDARHQRLQAVDATAATLVEIDHFGLAITRETGLDAADVRAIAWDADASRLAVDRAAAEVVRYDADGRRLP